MVPEEFLKDQEEITPVIPDISSIDPKNIWASYDEDLDTLIMYLTGKPVPGVSTFYGNDMWVITALDSNEVVGFQIEAWEKSFVPRHSEVAGLWPSAKNSIAPGEGWSNLLRVLALIVVFVSMFSFDENQHPQLTPA